MVVSSSCHPGKVASENQQTRLALDLPEGFHLLQVCPESYVVVILDGPTPPPLPAYVDIWVNDNVFTNEVAIETPLLYKLTWSASQEWIERQYNANGGSYIGPVFGRGIPLLNATNHTP